jgi:hypothetical protein
MGAVTPTTASTRRAKAGSSHRKISPATTETGRHPK